MFKTPFPPSQELIRDVRISFNECNSFNLINLPPSIVTSSNTSLLHKNCQQALSLLEENSLQPFDKCNGLEVDDALQLSNFDFLIESINRTNVNLKISRDYNSLLYLSVRQVFNANVILNPNMKMEWVTVLGIHENQSSVHISSVESRYKVFQMIQDQAQAAMLHFCSADQPMQGIKEFFAWVGTYSNLFSAKCKSCGLHLKNFLPPTCRNFKTLIFMNP